MSKSSLTDRVGVPVVIGNDADLAAIAERRERPNHIGSLLMLTIGTGIGMGFVPAGGRMSHPGHFGEVGHVLVDPAGDSCPCGRVGCWETKISGRRLDLIASELTSRAETGRELVERALSGGAAAVQALSVPAGWLAWGVESLALALDPALVVLGGAVGSHAAPILIPVISERLTRLPGAIHRNRIEVEASILGSDAGAIGAAIAVEEEMNG